MAWLLQRVFMFWEKNKSVKKFYIYDDTCGKGRRLLEAAKRQKLKARLFKTPWFIPNKPTSIIFYQMRPEVKHLSKNKKFAEKLAGKDKAVLIPSINECRLFYDKVAQYKKYSDFMPLSWHITRKAEAEVMGEKIQYPFISKSRESRYSNNIRLIRNKAEALKEIASVFSAQGMPVNDDRVQKDYVFWQTFVPDNSHDCRVIIIAKKFGFVVKRFNRESLPFASGGDRFEEIRKLNDEVKELLDYGIKFARNFKLSYLSLDLLRDKKGKLIAVESECAWAKKHVESTIFENQKNGWVPTKYHSYQLSDLIVQAVIDGDFNE